MIKGAFRVQFASKNRQGTIFPNSFRYDVVARDAVDAVKVAKKVMNRDPDYKNDRAIPEQVDHLCWLDS